MYWQTQIIGKYGSFLWGGGTPPMFGKSWAAEGLRPWPCSGQTNPKIHTLLWTTTSILWPYLGQNMCCLVLRPFFDNCNRPNTHYIKQYGLFAWKYKQISSTKSNQLRMQYPFYDLNRICLGQLGNYIPCLGQRGQKPHPVQLHFPV